MEQLVANMSVSTISPTTASASDRATYIYNLRLLLQAHDVKRTRSANDCRYMQSHCRGFGYLGMGIKRAAWSLEDYLLKETGLIPNTGDTLEEKPQYLMELLQFWKRKGRVFHWEALWEYIAERGIEQGFAELRKEVNSLEVEEGKEGRDEEMLQGNKDKDVEISDEQSDGDWGLPLWYMGKVERAWLQQHCSLYIKQDGGSSPVDSQ